MSSSSNIQDYLAEFESAIRKYISDQIYDGVSIRNRVNSEISRKEVERCKNRIVKLFERKKNN